MRRVILLPAFFYVSGIILFINICENSSPKYLLIVAISIFLSLYYCHKLLNFSSKKVMLLFLCLLLGALNSFAQYSIFQSGLENYTSRQHRFIINIDKLEVSNDKIKIVGNVERIDKHKADGWVKVRVDCYNIDEKPSPGDYISVLGKCEEAKAASNPHCFNYKMYLLSQGIYYTISCNKIEIVQNGNELKSKLYCLKESFINKLSKSLDSDEVGLIKGICFGDKSSIDEESLTWFQENGTAHVLAVSGLHIGIIYLLLKRLLYKKHRIMFYFAVAFALAFYGVITQWSVSVVRATMIIGVSIFAFVLEKPYDMTSGTVFVGLFLLLINPFQLYSTGFQMSFLAVLSLSFFSRHISEIISKLDKYDHLKENVVSTLSTVISIQISLSIFTAYTFNYFSIISILANIPTVFLISYLVPIVFIQFIFNLIFGFIPLSQMTGILIDLASWFNKICWNQGKFTFTTESFRTILIGFVLLLLFYLASEFFEIDVLRKNKVKIVASIAMICLISVCLFYNVDDRFNKAEVIFVDVGQGDCLHVRTDLGDYLIDGGGKPQGDIGKTVLRPYLLKNGCKSIKGVIATHNHTDHYLGLCQLGEHLNIERVLVSSGYSHISSRIKSEIKASKYYFINNGDRVNLSKKVWVQVLWPNPDATLTDESDENSVSLVMMLHYCGKKILITGDIDESCEKALIERYGNSGNLKCDILKVAHHGSKYSTCEEFLDAARPKIAVISVGKNNYGHPSQEIIDRLNKKGCKVYRTDEMGAIGFDFDAGKIVFGRKEI